ncbi:MAG: DUF4145 domain-containing protein [Elusimicrobia bacterium]|nr:DUF4145 domain-containing protein [Elusimicrobiota bacterium]
MKNEKLLTIPSYQQLVKQYHKNTDREAAILAGSFVEAFTEKFLRAFMKEHSEVDRLFKSYGPLSTFAARIDSAWGLGYIPDNVKNDLTYIRKIRNYFAHHPAPASFSDSEPQKWCSKLTTAQSIRDPSDNSIYTETEPRLQYLLAVGIAVATMHNTMLKKKKAKKVTQ